MVQDLYQPARNAVFAFKNSADPEIKLLPIDVLVASVQEPLPRDTAGLSLCPFAGEALHSCDVVPFWDPASSVQFGVPSRLCPDAAGLMRRGLV